jgi:nucleoprotein TPR
VDKLREAERGLRMSNVAALAEYKALYLLLTETEQEKLSTRIRENQVARQKATEEQDAAIKAAVEKATSELRNAPSTAPDELVKQHAEELRALEERLVAKHREELNKANEAAAAKAQASQSAPANALTAEDQKTAIDTAVAAQEAALKAKHDAAVEKALENGRLEATMKLRLKDTQLVRAQNKVKELEGQIEEWKKAGIIPGGTAAEPTSALSATSSSVPVRPPSTSAPSPTTSTPRGGIPMGAGAALARKASVASGAATGAAGPQPARGRGRGGVRGSIGIRGAGVPGIGRGANAAPQSSAGGIPAASAGGVSIMGAASKRTREEGEVLTEDSLSKRLKPAVPPADAPPATTTAAAAEGSAGTSASAAPGSNTGGKPITLQRNRVQPS